MDFFSDVCMCEQISDKYKQVLHNSTDSIGMQI